MIPQIEYCKRNNKGFTLVELMVTLAMSGIIVAVVYAAYIIQQKTYRNQGQVVEMQQNIRASLELMSSEIRMAGYDPTGDADAAISTANATQLGFTQDINEDGDVADQNENIVAYSFGDTNNDGTPDDSNGDGIVDCDDDGDGEIDRVPFRRNTGGGLLPIAENINAINYYYTLDDGTNTVAPTDLSKIAAVKISMLAVSGQRDPKYTDTRTYATGDPTVTWGPFNDNYRRRLLTSTVNFRNRGF